MYQNGWFQIAFEDELDTGLNPLTFGTQRLAAIKQPDSVRIIDATCPHRGAHLGYGGKFADNEVVCPFHGFRIAIGENQSPYCVREYQTFVCGGMVFVRLSDAVTPDLPTAIKQIENDHIFVKGLSFPVNTNVEMATENALDSSHFKEVHGLPTVPDLNTRYGELGELVGEGVFTIPTPFATAEVKYATHIFSPGVVISKLDGQEPYNYIIISTAAPGESPGTCLIRLTAAVLPARGKEADREFAQFLINDSQRGLELDSAIWNHLALNHKPRWAENDHPAIEFARFCSRFQA